MSTQILLPKIGFASSDSTLSRWLVEDGTQVTEGQPLFELENEKSAQEIEAPASGKLKILAAEGAAYPVGTVLAEIDG